MKNKVIVEDEVRDELKFQGVGWNSHVETEMTNNGDKSLSHMQPSEKQYKRRAK